MIAAAVAVGAVVATRLATGRSFENMGQQVNNLLLGDVDDEGRAAVQSRQYLEGRHDLLYAIGKAGKADASVKRLFDTLQRSNMQEERGRSIIMSDKRFQVNTKADLTILAMRDHLVRGWTSHGGPAAVEKLREGIGLTAERGAR
jgi:hypothetical protein